MPYYTKHAHAYLAWGVYGSTLALSASVTLTPIRDPILIAQWSAQLCVVIHVETLMISVSRTRIFNRYHSTGTAATQRRVRYFVTKATVDSLRTTLN